MSNSTLVSYSRISPNKGKGRNHAIDTITIHCMVAQWTAKKACDYFANSKVQASCNYAVGVDGSIGLCVDECDRSWCSSNAANDNRAVTIEVASNTSSPYAVTTAAYNALIELVTDICKRNGITKLVWSNDKKIRTGHLNGANMTVHRDFKNKACPGEYLYSRMGQIASLVNVKLNPQTAPAASAPSPTTSTTGSFKIRTLDDMTIRTGPGAWYPIKRFNGAKKNNVFTIVEEKNNWGRLISGAGWINISSKYAIRL